MADGGIAKKPGGASQPENYSTDTGRFVSDGSVSEASNSSTTSVQNAPEQSYYDNLADDQVANIRIKLALLRLRNAQGILAQDSHEKQRGKKQILDENQILQSIPNFISDAIVQKARQNNFDYMYLDANGRPHTNYGTSEFLTNEIAREHWTPFGVITRAKFDHMEREIKNNSLYYGDDEGFLRSGPVSQVPYGMTYRGIATQNPEFLKKIYDGYVGETEPDLLITMGCYGEGIYTSPMESTARDYAQNGVSSHVMRMIVDRRNANMAEEKDVRRIQSFLMNNLDKIKQSVIDKYKGKLSDEEANKMGDLVTNTIKYDSHFGILLAGYDAIQSTYLLLLNGRCIYTEKESFDEKFKNQ